MKTITMHVSEETAKALEIDKQRLECAEKMLARQLKTLESQLKHSPFQGYEILMAIEVTHHSIISLNRVIRFDHDVLSAYRCAPSEVE